MQHLVLTILHYISLFDKPRNAFFCILQMEKLEGGAPVMLQTGLVTFTVGELPVHTSDHTRQSLLFLSSIPFL
jgi:hypothetical protein